MRLFQDFKTDKSKKPGNNIYWNILRAATLLISGYLVFKSIRAIGGMKTYSLINIDQSIIESKCPLLDYVRPESYYRDNSTLDTIISDETFRNQSAQKLSGAVQIKTDVQDNCPSVKDNPEYWEKKFKPFHEYLEKTFPIVWKNFKVETVNTWGLVISWEGTEKDLKPLLLTAHQDVVPIQDATMKDWTYPPYDGVYDGSQLWGRGSADCKNLLIGLLESAEELYKSGFRPKRTIIYGFGFDEEIGGAEGALSISQFLLERYGKDSIYALVDEGGQSIVYEEGVLLALPGTSEKGSANVIVGLNTPGGHSSVPPDHTSIGIISKLIDRLEEDPFEAIFTPSNPTFHEFQCIAVHSPTLNEFTRSAILKSEFDSLSNKRAIQYLVNKSLTTRYLISTSQAIDVIHGGAKSNALPEYVEVTINHRISIEGSFEALMDRNLGHVKAIADRFDLGVIYNNKEIKRPTEKGYFTVKVATHLDPAPLTPTNDTHWEIFGGTIRHIYEEVSGKFLPAEYKGKPVVVAPGIANGNTDTNRYWDLTNHIYRYRPGLQTTVEAHAHGVDEHIPFDSHLQIIAFYYEYIQVVDSAE